MIARPKITRSCNFGLPSIRVKRGFTLFQVLDPDQISFRATERFVRNLDKRPRPFLHQLLKLETFQLCGLHTEHCEVCVESYKNLYGFMTQFEFLNN